jgi:hypothetical protein
MPSYIQIGDDPTKWWLPEQFQASQLTGQPLTIEVSAPVQGTLVLSPKSASIAIVEVPSATVPQALDTVAAIYVPSAAGLSAANAGYELPTSINVADLPGQFMNLLRDGFSTSIPLGGSAPGGTLVLNGATLSFVVVIKPGATREPESPVHDSEPSG